MNRTNSSFANRCLPMRIADEAGWFLLNDRPLRAKWGGGRGPESLSIECSGSAPYAAVSHFGEGILTFLIPFLFRTSTGTAVLFRGPANMPKDSIAPLEAIVETDWAIAPASMNWKFTRSQAWVDFAANEPICMVVPQRLDILENAKPRIMDVKTNVDLSQKFKFWCDNCRSFNERLQKRDAEAVRLGWQRYYFKGTAPHAASEVLVDSSCHRISLRLSEFAEHE
jgi:hypothetical protein